MLEVSGLTLTFTQYQVGLRRRELRVIYDLALEISRGEIVAVVGASGSGKSLLAHAILGILPRNARVSGIMRFDGEDLTPERQRKLRGRKIALVPQAITFLDPLMRVGRQARDVGSLASGVIRQRQAFARYGLGRQVEEMFPFQLSGGMLRRVLLCTAVLSNAALIIADEPTPGLDEMSVREAFRHLRELGDGGSGVMLITHDLMAACSVADKIAVFYAGTTLEVADSSAFIGAGERLHHPYTRALWRSLPENEFRPTPGAQPMPDRMPRGCVYQPRCAMATSQCETVMPEVSRYGTGWVRCFHA